MSDSLVRGLALLIALALTPPALAQFDYQEIPRDWHHLDLERDGFAGMSTFRAYEELLAGRTPQRSVIVAVIDSGVDTSHTALTDRLWINPAETTTSTGYVGARFGWSFLGNPQGDNVHYDTYEYAREFARLRPRFQGVDRTTLEGQDLEDFQYYIAMRDSLEKKRIEFKGYQQMVNMAGEAMRASHAALAQHFGREDFSIEDLEEIDTLDPMLLQMRDIMVYLMLNGLDRETLEEQEAYIDGMLTYSLNPDFDPRHIVGDDYDDLTERYYGNPDVHGPDPAHGTGVGGLVAARWDAEFGTPGVASDSVFIMAVRAVPQGDERDKDVANAIRFAVDHGAHVINMSFGKGISPQKKAVDEAVRYAMERGVLMINAAGNDGHDLRTTTSFPSRTYLDGTEAELWLTVGASAAFPEMLAASFSNWGPGIVDVFAPGEDIFALAPGDTTTTASGTSFAAPQVAGLAALLMAYFPELSPADVRDIILETATPFDIEVPRPGSATGEMVTFSGLSTTGAVINVYAAVQRALELSTP